MVPLYLAKDLVSLKEQAEKDIPPTLKLKGCLASMKKLDESAKEYLRKKDQEQEYTFLYRYFLVMKQAQKYPEFTRVLYPEEFYTSRANVKRLEILQDLLDTRYQERENNDQNAKFSDKAVVSISTPYKGKTPYKDIPITHGPALFELPRKSIRSEELYALCNSKNISRTSLLIIDARSSLDFKESHINCQHIINIPEEIISIGLSANALSKSIPADIKEKWEKRSSVEKLVIFDWNSREENLNPNSKLHHLREAMTKWDYCTTYKSPILILEGGYEDFLAKYPHLTTNPRVIPPLAQDFSIPSLDSFDYPVLEPEIKKKPPPPRSVSPPPPPPQPPGQPEEVNGDLIIDRTTKPSSTLLQQDESSAEKPPPGLPNRPQDHSKSESSLEIATESSSEDIVSPDEKKELDLKKAKESEGDTPSQTEVNPKQLLDQLRKVKPDIPVSNISKEKIKAPETSSIPSSKVLTENRSSDKRGGDGVTRIPLKKDDGASSGGGILKRSSSSPNIAKLDDDAPLTDRTPNFTRANKPVSYAERTEATYGKTAAGLTGLKNFANNCYMNSILQCLSNTRPLVAELISINRQLAINYQSKTKGKIAQEVIAAFRNIWSGDVRVYSIKDLKNLMGGLKEIFKGSGHQDSNEFLIILLEYLHDDLNIPANVESRLDGAREETGERAWGEFRRKNCSIIQRLFYGQHRSTVTCSTCGHFSVTFEQFFNLYVPIPSPGTVTLNDCIQLYMSGEKISGWKCPKCKEERNATKKFDISRLPPILVIALKRFTNEEDSWLQKNENLVTYPLEGLDMERFTVRGSEQRYKRYNLYAMSTHTGTLRAGHYKAICKNHITDKWYMFDDQSVEPLPTHSVRNIPEVYILFYSAELNT